MTILTYLRNDASVLFFSKNEVDDWLALLHKRAYQYNFSSPLILTFYRPD